MSHPHRGVIVFQPTVEDLVETYDIRIPLEALAIEKAVPNMTDADISELAGILLKMESAQADVGRYRHLNVEYHAALYRPARRPKLEKLISDMRDASSAYMRFYAGITPVGEQLHRDHVEIFAACRAGAPKKAAQAMKRHLRHMVAHISAALGDVIAS